MNKSWASNKLWTSYEQFKWSSESNSIIESNSIDIELSQIVHVVGGMARWFGGGVVLLFENNAISVHHS